MWLITLKMDTTITLLLFPSHPDPSQYMMALQGLLPDDEAMMNLAIALSLHEGVSGGRWAARRGRWGSVGCMKGLVGVGGLHEGVGGGQWAA